MKHLNTIKSEKIVSLMVLLILSVSCQNKEPINIAQLVNNSYACLNQKDLVTAKEYLFNAKEINPKDKEVLCLQAYILLIYDKNKTEAQTIIDKVLAIDNKYGRAYYIQGRIDNYNQKSPCGNLKKAVELGFDVPKELLFLHNCGD